MTRERYRIYDRWHKRWLKSYQVPLDGIEAAVTVWSEDSRDAMLFPGVKSAKGAILAFCGRFGMKQYAIMNERMTEVKT